MTTHKYIDFGCNNQGQPERIWLISLWVCKPAKHKQVSVNISCDTQDLSNTTMFKGDSSICSICYRFFGTKAEAQTTANWLIDLL